MKHLPTRVIVTGGAGFIGSALTRFLVKEKGIQVLNIDKLTYAGNLESLSPIRGFSNYHFVEADICNARLMNKIFLEFQPDVVMHLAAESHVDRSIDCAGDFVMTNVVGTYTLLEAVRNYYSSLDPGKQERFRFHHISTDEVYGDLAESEAYFTETTSYSPSSPYSATKASSDHLVRAWGRTYRLPIIVTNCSNNYGPYQFPEKLIPLTILNAMESKCLPVYGEGNQIRDWLYIDDHVNALFEVVTRGRIGETYNIGGNNEKLNIDVVRTICSLLEEYVPASDPYQSLISHVEDRPGHDTRYAIDASKIQRELGWYPSETFETGLRKTVEWYLANSDWTTHVRDGSYQFERFGEVFFSERDS